MEFGSTTSFARIRNLCLALLLALGLRALPGRCILIPSGDCW